MSTLRIFSSSEITFFIAFECDPEIPMDSIEVDVDVGGGGGGSS